MLYRLLLSTLLSIQFAYHATAQHTEVKYTKAEDIINMAKKSGKPYLWIAMYIPKCKNADELFNQRTALYNKYKDKIDLVMLTVLRSNDNINILSDLSDKYKFSTAYYVMDTSYAPGNPPERPAAFMTDLYKSIGEDYQYSQHIVIDKNGKLVYRTELDMTGKALQRALK